MKATGIVRRIDELGRIVLPKEVRKTLRIKEGDPLEIYTDKDGAIILKKYSPMLELKDVSGYVAQAISKATGHTVFITDRHNIINAAGKVSASYIGTHIGSELEQIIEDNETLPMVKTYLGEQKFSDLLVTTIIVDGSPVGSIIIAANVKLDSVDHKLAQTFAYMITKQLED
jgi:AbrB family transcriptional regulator (stage V sporulation protein T)